VSTAYILLAVVMVSIGQILQKTAASEIKLGNGLPAAVASLVRSSKFWQATLAMAVSLMLWLMALADVEVSKAYPILGLSFAITTTLSVLLLGERVGPNRWLGVCLISVGATVMAFS